MPRPKDTNELGLRGGRRRAQSLALVLRERFPPDVIADMGEIAASGMQPLAVRDTRCASGFRVTAGGLLTPELQLQWMKMVLDRAHGQAAQHVVMDAEVRGQMAQVNAIIPAEALEATGGSARAADVLDAFRAALAAKRGGAATINAPSALPVLDVSSAVHDIAEPEGQDEP